MTSPRGSADLDGKSRRKLIGGAVICTIVPPRSDLHETTFAVGMREGRKGNDNQWVIDSLAIAMKDGLPEEVVDEVPLHSLLAILID